MITAEQIVEISKYFTVIHHIKGRIRIRVNPKIKEEASSDITIDMIEELPGKIKGIRSLKINKIVGSITIEYEPEIFSKELWDDLIGQRNLEEIVEILNRLKEEL